MSLSNQRESQELRYNERAWVIDLISFINSQLGKESEAIKRASGEYSLSTDTRTLFPDLLLFGDQSTGKVLQGWELKLPETPVDDPELIENASIKAKNLGLDSFVVWNAKQACLYTFDKETASFRLDPTALVSCPLETREDVHNRPDIWQQAAKDIVRKLNDYFRTGRLSGVTPQIVFSDGGIVNQLLSCHAEVESFLRAAMIKNKEIDAQINSWWAYVKNEYPGYEHPVSPLAYFILFHWFNRFIFTNILVAYNKIPISDDLITPETTVEGALSLFQKISEGTNYWALIGPHRFDACIPQPVWDVLKGIFKVMADFEFSKISKDVLSEVIKSAVLSSIKKTAGLYATPENVAELLVRLAMNEKDGQTIDPFCGTGTIPEKVLEIKSEYHISGKEAVQQTWASDKFAFPIQVATLAIASPQVLDEPLKVFVHDAFTLYEGELIELRNPKNGENQKYPIPRFSTIVSNLPFVRFEDLAELNPDVLTKINSFYAAHSIPLNERLSGRGDLYTYVPFLIYDLLLPGGYLGVIISNSWLSTESGKSFSRLLRKFYHVEQIVISGKGRWFHNTDVVTNLLICRKLEDIEQNQDENKTAFVINNISMDEEFDIRDLATDIINGRSTPEKATINTYTNIEINQIQDFGLSLNSCFSDIHWFIESFSKYTSIQEISNVYRGERRGWDPLFFPNESGLQTVESEFLRPVIKTNRGAYTYSLRPDSLAFCCNLSMDELIQRNKVGAFKWIKQFENQFNETGVPLTTSLRRARLYWYQMDVSKLADFVLAMNPDSYFMIQKLDEPAFINQRVIGLAVKPELHEEMDFYHALLNSTLTYFQIEAIGFGRGLGVLDINNNNIKHGLHIPKLGLFTREAKVEIYESFRKVKSRNVMHILQELNQPDRIELDSLIIKHSGLNFPIEKLYECMKQLYAVRKAI